MNTWQIRIAGIVQGVGFRPLVYQIATTHNIRGEVSNGVEGVGICFNETEEKAHTFYKEILDKKPRVSRITQSSLQKIDNRFFDNFQIIESEDTGVKTVLFTPDYALCNSCKGELSNSANRRHNYPFITCTRCGPRYSIIENLPYDRTYTSMASIEMCSACEEEFKSPVDRRHFSQTNSCGSCGGDLVLKGKNQREYGLKITKEIKERVIQIWEEGQIIAIKGIGGYLLTCDSFNQKAIKRLRKLKYRPSKPFAVMYPSLEALSDFYLSHSQKKELMSEISPIVLLRRSKKESLLPDSISEGLEEVGVMIPYAPVFKWLLEEYKKPIIASSGNISNSPIVFRESAEDELFEIADYILSNNRKIVIPQDDSVLRFSKYLDQRIVIRRSRGIAPNYFSGSIIFPNECILACGADLKSSFTLLHQGNVYISQYLGDLSHYDTQKVFSHVYTYMSKVLASSPEIVLHDKHPDYSSTHLATKLALENKISLDSFQHHKAHFAAVLGENELINTN